MKTMDETTRSGSGAGPAPLAWTGVVLVADDNDVNRELLQEILEDNGHQTIPARDGVESLSLALEKKPDLILLDVMMPGLDGYQVCAALKKEPAVKDIPVIFITARVEPKDLLRGFEVGAVDYVTKPVRVAEVLARVNAWMRIIRLERERALALEAKLKADQWEAVKTISAGLAHNFNNILASAMGNLQYLQKEIKDPDHKEAVADSLEALEQAKRLVALMQKYHDFKFDPEPVELGELIAEELQRFRRGLRSGVKLEAEIPEALPRLLPGARPYLLQILEAVLQNAQEAIREQGQISITASLLPGNSSQVKIEVRDNGNGLTGECAEKAFLPFFSTKNTVGVGLGLYAARLAVERIDGTIQLEPDPAGGALLTIVLPALSP